MKRLTSILLCLALILNIFSFSVMAEENYNFSDEQQALLTAIGMLNENLVLSDKVTRAEFADMLVHSVFDNPEYLIEGTETFNDVAVTHDYYSSIMLLKNLGVTLGDGNGNFKPEEKILSNDAVVMAVRFLGYSKIAEKYGTLAFASSKGITKGVVYTADEELSLYNALLIVFNVLNTDVTDQYANQDTAATFLNGYRNLFVVKGTVTDDGVIDQYGVSDLPKNKIAIDGKVYINSTDEKNLFGCTVKGYYRQTATENAELIAVVKTKDNETLVLDSKNIENYDAVTSTYTYRESEFDEDVEEVQIPNGIPVVYNGVPITLDDMSFTEKDFVPETGRVVLFDNDGDKNYDILYIYSYETYVVSKTDVDKRIIYMKEFKGSLDLNEYDSEILDSQNENVELSSIVENNVLSVLRSLSGDILKVYVSKESITDIVLSKDDEGIIATQNNGEYELSKSFINEAYEKAVPKADRKDTDNKIAYANNSLEFSTLYKFCLDVFGDIAYVHPETVSLWKPAMLITASNNSRSQLAKNYEIMLYSLDGNMITLKPTEKVRILKEDNTEVRCEDKKAIDIIFNYCQANSNNGNRLVRYKINEKGLLTEIEFPLGKNVEISEVNSDRLYIVWNASATKAQYTSGSFVGKALTNSATKVVIMPNEITQDEKKYAITTTSLFVHDGSYNFIAYGTDTKSAKTDYMSLIGEAQKISFAYDSRFIISKIIEVYDHENDERRWKLEGFAGTTAKTVYVENQNVMLQSPDLSNNLLALGVGDIIAYSAEKSSVDEVLINGAYILYDADGVVKDTGKGMFGMQKGAIPGAVSDKLEDGTKYGNPAGYTNTSGKLNVATASSTHSSPFSARIAVGLVYSYDANTDYITLTTQPINTQLYKSMLNNNGQYITESYNAALGKTLVVKKYSDGKVDVKKASANDIKPYTIYGHDCSRVVYANYWGLKVIYILENK